MKGFKMAKCKPIPFLVALLPFLLTAFEMRALSMNECDTIITKDGSIIIATIEKVSESEIIYAECPVDKGWKKAIPMRSVKAVRSHAFGERANRILSKMPAQIDLPVEISSPKPYQEPDHRKTHKLAIFSFVFGVISLIGLLFVYTLGFGLFLTVPLSVILGFMALKRIRRNKGKYKGRGLAIAGIVFGFIVVAVILREVGEVLIYGID